MHHNLGAAALPTQQITPPRIIEPIIPIPPGTEEKIVYVKVPKANGSVRHIVVETPPPKAPNGTVDTKKDTKIQVGTVAMLVIAGLVIFSLAKS